MKYLIIIVCLCFSNANAALDDELPLAELGDPNAQLEVGMIFFKENDFKKATPWLLKSAEQGNKVAQNTVAAIYETGGWGSSERDFQKAVYWYSKAVDQDYDTAQVNLGALYQFGLGVPKDLNKALSIFELTFELRFCDIINLNLLLNFIYFNPKKYLI